MAFETDTWTSPALQPPTHDHTLPRKGRRPSRYNTIISLDDLDGTSGHRQPVTERRSRYHLASTGPGLADVSPHFPSITLTSPQESAASPFTRPVARNPLRGHTSTTSVSHDDTEPFLGRAADTSNPEPKLLANREESQPQSRLSQFNVGPYYPEVPGSQNAFPGKSQGASHLLPE